MIEPVEEKSVSVILLKSFIRNLGFDKHPQFDSFVMTMSKNGQVDLSLLEKVLDNKGRLSKF